MIDLKNHYGFTRTPFGKDLAPSMLCRYPAHAEAVGVERPDFRGGSILTRSAGLVGLFPTVPA